MHVYVFVREKEVGILFVFMADLFVIYGMGHDRGLNLGFVIKVMDVHVAQVVISNLGPK
mgnify:CR=1 FL=1